MSEIELIWGSGLQAFKFGLGQFRALQENVNRRRLAIGAPLVGPMDLVEQLRAKNVWPDDLRDILRLGLIGGGMAPRDAHLEMAQHFDDKPPLPHMMPALTVLMAGLVGPPEAAAGDDAKKRSRRARRRARRLRRDLWQRRGHGLRAGSSRPHVVLAVPRLHRRLQQSQRCGGGNTASDRCRVRCAPGREIAEWRMISLP
ncbi:MULTISPECIES: gene transfer agent family protein [Bradyrhizobium]|uniref:gene transfer agent family protein n=1 Tax=Bradyrhizobium sp. USDA 241 TaxID=3377725 RepID=UPI003C70E16A